MKYDLMAVYVLWLLSAGVVFYHIRLFKKAKPGEITRKQFNRYFAAMAVMVTSAIAMWIL